MSMIRLFSAGRDWVGRKSPDPRPSRCQGADLDQVVRQDTVADPDLGALGAVDAGAVPAVSTLALLREGLSRDRIALPDRGLTGCADFAAIDQRLQVLVLPCVNSRAVHAQNYFAGAIFRPSQGIAASKIRGRLASR